METFILWLFFWLIVGSIVGQIFRRQPIYGAALAMLCGPFGFVFIPLLPDLRTHCKSCRSVVDPEATICRYCREPLAE